MTRRATPGLHREMAKFGGGDILACMNCGACTATCPLSSDSGNFPRRIIHLLQVGLPDRLDATLDPWLCYACGECSESCPREARPDATMMAARRFLISRYDRTGIGRHLYRSAALQTAAVLLVGLAAMLLMLRFHGPVVTDRVALTVFAPVGMVEVADWIVAGTLGTLLLLGAYRMYRLVLRENGIGRIPLSAHLRAIPVFFSHFLTQRRTRECEKNRGRWLRHLLLVSGYVTMMLLVEVGLRWFQTDEVRPFLHPTRILGYYATAVLLYGSVDFLTARFRKRDLHSQESHHTDWMFLALLTLVAVTGILVHVFRLSGWPLPTYAVYTLHLGVVAPFLIVQVPFGKWSHMLYRPFAVYLDTVIRSRRQNDADVAARAVA